MRLSFLLVVFLATPSAGFADSKPFKLDQVDLEEYGLADQMPGCRGLDRMAELSVHTRPPAEACGSLRPVHRRLDEYTRAMRDWCNSFTGELLELSRNPNPAQARRIEKARSSDALEKLELEQWGFTDRDETPLAEEAGLTGECAEYGKFYRLAARKIYYLHVSQTGRWNHVLDCATGGSFRPCPEEVAHFPRELEHGD